MIFRHAIRPFVLAALVAVGLVALRQPRGATLGAAQASTRQSAVERALAAWEKASAANTSFAWHFTHYRYDPTLQPPNDLAGPVSVAAGELRFQAPDKVVYREDTVRNWQISPSSKKLENVETQFGEHWACDGKRVYEVDHRRREIIANDLPPNWRFTEILPFAERIPFGITALDLAAHYKIEIISPAGRAGNETWLHLHARPSQHKTWLGFTITDDSDADVILRADDLSLVAIRITALKTLSGSYQDVWLFEPWHAPAQGAAPDDSFTPSLSGYRFIVQSVGGEEPH